MFDFEKISLRWTKTNLRRTTLSRRRWRLVQKCHKAKAHKQIEQAEQESEEEEELEQQITMANGVFDAAQNGENDEDDADNDNDKEQLL